MSFDLTLQAPDALSLTKNDIFTVKMLDLAKNPLNWHKIEVSF